MLVIPAIDLIDGCCVRLRQGRYDRQTNYDPDPVARALSFQKTGFKRLHTVDLDGARLGRGRNRKAVQEIVEAVGIPVQTGGGIRSDRDVAELLEAGVRYLVLGTVALESPGLVEAWIGRWGPGRFIVSLDLKAGQPQVRGWTSPGSPSLDEAVDRIAAWGVDQVICTDVERDGTLGEPGYAACREVLGKLKEGVRLIAAGGVSCPAQLGTLGALGVFGAIVGRALYEGDHLPEEFVFAG